MSRRARRGIWIVIAAGLLVGIYSSDQLLFSWPEAAQKYAGKKLGRHLEKRHGIAFLMTFDEAQPREYVSRTEAVAPGTESTSGRSGRARTFDGTRWSGIHVPVQWSEIGTTFSISLQVWIEPPSGEQDLLFSSISGRSSGLKIEEGRMTLYAPGSDVSPSISYPFERWGEWVNVISTIDADTGVMRLYENGVLMAEATISSILKPVSFNINIGARRWYKVRDPFRGKIDEAVIWKRVLSEREIAALVRQGPGLLRRAGGARYWLAQGVEGMGILRDRILRGLDYFNPLMFPARAREAGLPSVNLVLSKKDARHFNQRHRESLASGRRTSKASEVRSIEFMADDRAARARLVLDGGDNRYGGSVRKSLLLESEEPIFGDLTSIRLVPPEDAGWLVPLMDAQIARRLDRPHVANGWCRLFINGRFEGIYFYEDNQTAGTRPGGGDAAVMTPEGTHDWMFRFQDPMKGLPLSSGLPRHLIPISRDEMQNLYEQVADDALRLLGNDAMAPFCRRELAYRIRQQRNLVPLIWVSAEAEGAAQRVADYLSPYMLLGSNPSPHFVHQHLDLPVSWGPDVQITWSSSAPDIISALGQVTCPVGDRPAGVVLTAMFEAGGSRIERTYELRVMPEFPRLPSLMMYTRDHLQRASRADARIDYYPSGSFTPVSMRATQERGAGIKFRGNTSFWQIRHSKINRGYALRKVPFSIEFDQPHHLLNRTDARHLYLATGYVDVGLTHNFLAYRLFNAASEPGALRRAPDLMWVELYVDGRYLGVYEAGSRVDRHLLGYEPYEPGDPDPALLYKFQAAGHNFARPNPEALNQKMPPREYGHYRDPYAEMVVAINGASADEVARVAGEMVDIRAIMDFQLLVNLTENFEGVNANLFLARPGGPGGLFSIVPWDYDKTFGGRSHDWLSNGLTTRLWKDHPLYASGIAARWRELREGPWSDDVIEGLLQESERMLDGYVEWDYAAWDFRYGEGRSLEESHDRIRTRLLDRLPYLDTFLVHDATEPRVPGESVEGDSEAMPELTPDADDP